MCFEINTQLLLVERKEDETTTKFLLEQVMFFASGIKGKSDFVKSMCHPYRRVIFFQVYETCKFHSINQNHIHWI